MKEVYRDENIVLKRDGQNYSMDTTSKRASLFSKSYSSYSFKFSVNYVCEEEAYGTPPNLFLA